MLPTVFENYSRSRKKLKEISEKDKDKIKAEEKKKKWEERGLQAVCFSLMRLIHMFVSDLPCFLLLIDFVGVLLLLRVFLSTLYNPSLFLFLLYCRKHHHAISPVKRIHSPKAMRLAEHYWLPEVAGGCSAFFMQQAIGVRVSWLDMATENQSLPNLGLHFYFLWRGKG